MKKILLLANHAGGLLLFRKETLQGFIDAGYDVTVALPRDKGVDEIAAMGAKVESISVDRRGTNPFSDLALLWRYLRLIRRIQPDLVTTYTIKCNIYGGLACRLTRTPYLSTVTGLGSGLITPGLTQKLSVFLYRMGVKKCRKLFLQNAAVAEFFESHRIKARDSFVLPGSGVNLQTHPYMPYPSEEAGIRICFLGRLMREKGVGELLLAAERLCEKHQNLTFHLAGMAEEAGWLEKMERLSERGFVVYHGSLTDVRDLIARSHASVMPSYHEGMCNALMESAAMGRALLASDVPGCRETVGAENGFLFEVRNVDSIVACVERFLALTTEQREAMGKASCEKMRAEFDRTRVTGAYLDAAANVLNS